jgi:branched-chain amino acid transport system permease protein
MVELTLQALYSGALTGAYYAMIALGLALVFGTMRLINLAHGELVLLSAYITYEMEKDFGLNALAAIPVAAVAVGLVGLLTYWLIDKIKQDREINSLILTFGLATVLTNLMLMRWSADIHSTSNSWFQDGIMLGDSLFSQRAELIFAVVSVALIIAIHLWLSLSWQGRALRAVASQRVSAMLMGVNPRLVEASSFILASLLAAVSGAAVFTVSTVYPALGATLTVKAFVITVLAGLGSVPGVLAAAMLLGIGESLTATFLKPSLQELTAMVIFLAVLFLKPSGLFGRSNVVRR